jgi:hypothetical protein
LKITFCEFHEDEAGKQYIPKQYGWKPLCENFDIDLILMIEHYMPMLTLDKSISVISNCTIKLSPLISVLLIKGLFIRLDMNYWKAGGNTTFYITDLNCRLLDFNKASGKMKDSYD